MKKITLVLIIILTASPVFAQLTIKPNGTKPSYIYVKDQVVFVEGKIHLEENPGPNNDQTEYKASIYLRDGAQLIQGDDNSENTGNGYLSVRQKTDPTNAFAYYYWASPVGNSEDLGGQTGNINFGIGSIYEPIENSLTKAKKVNTTPKRNGFVNRPLNEDLTISLRWLYTMTTPSTENEDGYDRINANNAVPAGYGFTMKGVNDENQNPPLGDNDVKSPSPMVSHEQIYEFRGRPNNGEMKIQVAGPNYTGMPDPANLNSKMTLAGNPYPSALDLNWVFHDSENTALNAFYFYDEDRTKYSHLYSEKPYGFGVWIPGGSDKDPSLPEDNNYNAGEYVRAQFHIWNAAGHTSPGSTTSENPGIPTRIAPIGQGVMFVGTGNQTPVKIKNSHRRYIKQGEGSVFFRPSSVEGFATSAEDGGDENRNHSSVSISLDDMMSKLRLYVVFDEALTRDLLLTFSKDATDDYDRGFDGPSPYVTDSDAFFPINRNGRMEPYVINGTNFNKYKRIPLTVKLHKESTVEVFIAEEINKRYQHAYLYDYENNTFRPLAHLDGDRNINRLRLPAGTYEDRFFIVFDDSPIMPKPETIQEFKADVLVFQNNPVQQLEIRNPQGYDIKSVNLFDITGKLIFSEKNLGEKVHHSFPTSNLSDGVYIVKMITSTDMHVDYKVIVMNK